jgi:hypothetical protein
MVSALKQMQIDFATSIYDSIPAGEIEADWAKLAYAPNANCALSIYIRTI